MTSLSGKCRWCGGSIREIQHYDQRTGKRLRNQTWVHVTGCANGPEPGEPYLNRLGMMGHYAQLR